MLGGDLSGFAFFRACYSVRVCGGKVCLLQILVVDLVLLGAGTDWWFTGADCCCGCGFWLSSLLISAVLCWRVWAHWVMAGITWLLGCDCMICVGYLVVLLCRLFTFCGLLGYVVVGCCLVVCCFDC